jgi:hypothetical protein
VISSLSSPYNFSYRRLSATVHADFSLLIMVAGRPDALSLLDAQDAGASTLILLASAGVTLGLTAVFDPVVLELRHAFLESRLGADM